VACAEAATVGVALDREAPVTPALFGLRDFYQPRRSPVYATGGMAATSHPLATEAAVATLRAGGNAVDAAVTAAAVLCVVEPQMVGVGGDCFALVAEPDGSVHGLNGSGRAPAAADAASLRARGVTAISQDSVHSITVPGAVKAFEALLARFGTIGLDQALARAIDLAEGGFPVAPRVAWDWADAVKQLARHEGGRKHLLIDGRAPGPGDIMRFPALAATFRTIAEEGSDGLYRGRVAEDIVATVQALGGVMEESDLAAVSADWVEPISRAYRGLEVIELPPNGQGATALLMLAILERFSFSGLDPLGPERFHLHMEAGRAAYSVRDAEIGDPDHLRMAPEALFAEELVEALAAQIDPARRNPSFAPPEKVGSDTIYLTVADADGRIVSLIASLFRAFGTGYVSLETGVTLHSRGGCFTLEEGHPNEYGPRKRSMHTIIPALARGDGVLGAFGVMGAHYQPTGHAHVVGNLVDFAMEPQAAIEAPRMFFEEDHLSLEGGVPQATADGLAARGHRIVRAAKPHGGSQMIWLDRGRGVLVGASDPRKDGCALGL
jgi:gamma-glutamyltranspeptidase / glutathione hydrolase